MQSTYLIMIKDARNTNAIIYECIFGCGGDSGRICAIIFLIYDLI